MKFASPGFDIVSDFFGYTDGVKISVSGSQWFIVPQIISYFASSGIRVYVETLPSVLVRKRANGVPISLGNLQIEGVPHIICIDNELIRRMNLSDRFPAFEDHMCIAWSGKGNKPDLCEIDRKGLAIPNPQLSSIGMAFKKYYEKQCGYYGDLKGEAIICDLHHREIPQRILSGQANYGILWESEAKYWKFNHYILDKTGKKFSWILTENPDIESKKVFDAIKSGALQDFYRKYGLGNTS
ncbi:hypothetical protein [Ferroplasma sp.]|uniref:hypothetical protein n=1 Tax=Ferroplasma sp. TaxID=2591003 RepID=UPI00262A6C85|nr:hypothetical protein [Ferroplasma sp.]MCL4453398.1 substrate-binding domain-containing protein [Candidatus Thermoplasmatota archaeon]